MTLLDVLFPLAVAACGVGLGLVIVAIVDRCTSPRCPDCGIGRVAGGRCSNRRCSRHWD